MPDSDSDEPDWDSDEDEEEDDSEEEEDSDEEETDDDEEETDDDEEETDDDDEEETDDDDEEETDDDDEEETSDDEEETDDDSEEEDSDDDDDDEEEDSESEGFEDEPGGLAAAGAGSNIEGDEEKGFEDEDPDKPRGAAEDNERAKMVAGILCCCCIILAVVGVVLGVVVFGDKDDEPAPAPAATPKPTNAATPPPTIATSSPTAPPFTLPPTGMPSMMPTGAPVDEIPEMVEIEASGDTYITIGPDGTPTEAQGSGDVLEVFKGEDDSQSVTLIVFNLTDLPDLAEREKTAKIKLDHVPRDGETVRMTVFRLFNTTSDLEGLASETYFPDPFYVEGETFEVAADTTTVEINVTDLLLATDPMTTRRRLEEDDDSFIVRIQRSADGEPTPVPDEFRSRESTTPPELLIDIPAVEGGDNMATNATLCTLCPTGPFNNADAMVNKTALVGSALDSLLGDEDMITCSTFELALQNTPTVNEETCDSLSMELKEACGCTGEDIIHCNVCPPSNYTNPEATVDLSVLGDLPGLEDILPDEDPTQVKCSDVMEAFAVTDIGLDFWACGEVAEELSDTCGCELPVYCDVCPPGEFENPDAMVNVTGLPLGEFVELIPEGTEEVTCLQIEQLLAWMDLELSDIECTAAAGLLSSDCGCTLDVGRLRKNRRN